MLYMYCISKNKKIMKEQKDATKETKSLASEIRNSSKDFLRVHHDVDQVRKKIKSYVAEQSIKRKFSPINDLVTEG